MRADVLAYLRCPLCGEDLTETHRAVRCRHHHTFDVARQGYVHLAPGPLRHAGDTAAMVAARAGFLAAGHYAFIAEALGEAAAARAQQGLVVDVGAGTGYHLGAVLDALPGTVGLALDSSKAAARQAARAHPRAAAAVCDVWGRLPLADEAASLLINVFAPRNAAEFRRILAPEGTLLVVTPEPDHLTELVDALGLLRVDPSKEDRLRVTLGRPAARHRLARTLRLNPAAVAAVVAMGPSAWHTKPIRIDAPVTVTAAVSLREYRLR